MRGERGGRAEGSPVSVHTCSEIDVPKQTRVLQYLQKSDLEK